MLIYLYSVFYAKTLNTSLTPLVRPIHDISVDGPLYRTACSASVLVVLRRNSFNSQT